MGLTFLRLLLLPVFLWVMLAEGRNTDGPRWIAVTIFAVMAATDKLDGYLARRLKQSSKIGAILDPVADKILIACCVMLLSLPWVAPPNFRIPDWVVLAVYGKDLVTAIGCLVLLALVGTVTITPRPLGKASTVLQLAMVMAVLLTPPATSDWIPAWQRLVHTLFWLVTVLSVVTLADYVVQGIKQYRDAPRGHPKEVATDSATTSATDEIVRH
jgi:CDP-diacylglycerol--glycerol-3-phosphate 3-phosphatidyltransferase/cardiolipin synthase